MIYTHKINGTYNTVFYGLHRIHKTKSRAKLYLKREIKKIETAIRKIEKL